MKAFCRVLFLLSICMNSALGQSVFDISPLNVNLSNKAIFNDGVSSTTLTIDTKNAGFNQLEIVFNSVIPENLPLLTADGFPTPSVAFTVFDDGSKGDEVPGDGIFTLSQIKTQHLELPQNGWLHMCFEIVFNADALSICDPRLQITTFREFAYRNFDSTTLLSDRFVNFHNLPPDFDFGTESISRRFYDRFDDEYDFIQIFMELETGYSATYTGMRNNVTGIGVGLREGSEDSDGSAGRLLGMSRYVFPPGRLQIYMQSSLIFHEIGHQWIAFIDVPVTQPPHWRDNSTVHSVLSATNRYFTRNEVNGSFIRGCSGIARKYDHLDLYLMGSISAEELDVRTEIWVIEDPLLDTLRCNESIFPAVSSKITSEDIIEAHGPRTPSSEVSQKTFRTATIFVTDEPIRREDSVAINRILEHYSRLEIDSIEDPWPYYVHQSFYGFTEGKMSMDFRIISEPMFKDSFESE